MGVRGADRRDGHGVQRRLPRDLWATLYADFYPQIRGYFAARRLQRADAEDLAMQLFEQLGQSKTPRDAEPYIHVVARNLLARYHRNKARRSAALRKLLGRGGCKRPFAPPTLRGVISGHAGGDSCDLVAETTRTAPPAVRRQSEHREDRHPTRMLQAGRVQTNLPAEKAGQSR